MMDAAIENLNLSGKNEPPSKTIIVGDHHPLFRAYCSELLKTEFKTVRIIEAASEEEIFSLSTQPEQVNLILHGFNFPKTDIPGFFKGVLTDFPGASLGILTERRPTFSTATANACSALGFIPKTSTKAEFLKAVTLLLRGEIYFPPILKQRAAAAEHASQGRETSFEALTPTEKIVLACLQHGLTNREIAHEMGFTMSTSKAHVSSIMQKLGVRSRTQVVVATRCAAGPRAITPTC